MTAAVFGEAPADGVDPLDPTWSSSSATTAAEDALAVLVQHLIDQRAEARRAKDFATADRIRDQLAAAGVEVEDTPQGARWSLKEGER